jgi:hypothetical protein
VQWHSPRVALWLVPQEQIPYSRYGTLGLESLCSRWGTTVAG